jgi:hypothetical protein
MKGMKNTTVLLSLSLVDSMALSVAYVIEYTASNDGSITGD